MSLLSLAASGRPVVLGVSGADREPTTGATYAPWKRAGDVALATLLLVLTTPVILAAVLLVKLTSRGPAFYTQVRLGRAGRPFRIFKVRTMTHDCERHTGAVWSTPGDPRVFPVGRILRVLHLDELPQLVNVILGDMSLVGPRPERPAIAADLEESIPGYRDRLAVRPGVTGLAQVQFPADTDLGSVCQKLVADLQYAHAVRPGLDFRILLATALYLLHLPLSWRRRVLGPDAEPSPPAPGLGARLAAVYGLPQKPGRVAAVQGLRGVAASLVFLAHFLILFGGYLGGLDGPAARAVDAVARHGTDIFLLISGYLIYGMCVRRRLDYGRFLRARARRIYPAFLCVFALYLVLSVLFPAESKIPPDPAAAAWYLLENLALLPGLTGTAPVIVVTWTLGYELLLYVTLPLAVRVSGMRGWPVAARVAVLAAAWVGYLAYCGTASPGHVRLGIYLAGFLAYEAVEGRRQARTGRDGGALLAVAAGVGFAALLRAGVVTPADLPGPPAVLRAVAVGAAMFGVAYCCFGGGGVCTCVLSWAPLRWLGNMSYSFYLTHGLALKAAALAAATLVPAGLRGPGLFVAALPFCYLAALATATVLFALVERRWSFPTRPVTEYDAGAAGSATADRLATSDTVVDSAGVDREEWDRVWVELDERRQQRVADSGSAAITRATSAA